MNELNIARAIINKRKEKGITQEELAGQIGVSSAAVSKWETEQSYPDILLLPQLAAYFNISVDELIGYQPQMTKKDIAKLYCKLYKDLSQKPLDEVFEQCREATKKYFSCFPLLQQMGTLLVNAVPLIDDEEKSAATIAEAKELFVRVKTQSDDAELMKAAVYMEASCSMLLYNPNEVIELLGATDKSIHTNEVLLALAYQMTERNTEAETVLQVGIYQNITSVLSLLSTYIMFGADDYERFNKTVERTFSIIETFNIKKMQPSIVISCYLVAAQGYLSHQKVDKALDFLDKYAELVNSDFSLQFKGDSFFNLIDKWIAEGTNLGEAMPSNEIAKQSMADAVINNPEFSALSDNPRFQNIVKRLERIGG